MNQPTVSRCRFPAILLGLCAILAGTAPVAAQQTVEEVLTAAAESSWVKLNLNRYQDAWTPSAQQPKPTGMGASGGLGEPDALIRAWASMAWDSKRGDVLLFGGGHFNYSGNDVYRWRSSTRRWERASLPSQVRKVEVTDMVNYFEAVDGVDNAPISAHTYDTNEYLPVADRFITFGGAAFNTGRWFEDSTGRRVGPYLFNPGLADAGKVGGSDGSHVDPSTFPGVLGGNMWENRDRLNAEDSPGGFPGDFRDSGTAVTMQGGKDVMYLALKGGTALWKYTLNDVADPSADTFELVGLASVVPGDGVARQGPGALDTERNLFVKIYGCNAAAAVCNNSERTFVYWDLNNSAPANRYVGFDPQDATDEFNFDLPGDYGLDYDPIRQTFVLWDGEESVWRLTPPDDLTSGNWVLTKTVPTGDPPDRGTLTFTGIMGKWKYIRQLDAFVGLVGNKDGNLWAFKPSGWSPDFEGGNGGGGDEDQILDDDFES